MSQFLTIGILAHVDAGKTSLTECFLHASGATKKQGSVDSGSAVTDGLSMEKNRGISIKSATVHFDWKGQAINLVDTPGHIDFSAEVDRALSVLDLVVLVVSAKEGVQAHTLNLWESIRERELPVVVFVNKIDRDGVDLEQVFADFEHDLGARLFALNYADVSDPGQPKLIDFQHISSYVNTPIIDKSFENLAELDEAFFESYLEGDLGDLDNVLQLAHSSIRKRDMVGLVFGSAKLDMGVELLLDEIATSYDKVQEKYDSPSAIVFKVEYDPKLGRLAHVRSYGSAIKSKDVIWSQALNQNFKVNQLFKPDLGGVKQVAELNNGEIGLMTTSDLIPVGDVLGEQMSKGDFRKLSESVLGVQVQAQEDKDYQKLGEALEILNMEDPRLDFKWYKDEREFHLKILGTIQTEVLKESLEERFGVVANFMSPQVIYKETPSKSAEGYVRYWMPKPCWAILTFQIEPGPLGSGVVFNSKVRTTDISIKYQNEVKRSIPWSLKQGIHGWEVTDLEITLIEGTEHTVHSNPGDFLLATPMGVMRGLELAGTDLLEPMYAFEIKAHQDFLGPVSSDLNQMMAQLNAPVFQDDFFTITGRVSVERAMNYSIKFNATTSGKGRLKFTIDGYQKTDTTDDKIRAYKGVSPLDEAQWILHKRGAFKADER